MTQTYTVQRSATIAAPVDRVYPLIADLRAWTRWSPWEDIDPTMRRSYGGSESGVGATYTWSGNKKAGAGRMEIVEAVPDERVVIALDFEKPFKSSNRTTFLLNAAGEQTEARWVMVGPRPLFMRVFSFAFNLDTMVGKDFEKGLTRLDAAARSLEP